LIILNQKAKKVYVTVLVWWKICLC